MKSEAISWLYIIPRINDSYPPLFHFRSSIFPARNVT